MNIFMLAALCFSPVPVPGILTDREGTLLPPTPLQDDAFLFAVYGDRTGGPAEGIDVLRQAVSDTSLIDPDLVMTVGDLIQGYNARPAWLAQMNEFRTVMEGLPCPWYPVAGNHDIYWRGPGRPAEEHEADYEAFFGPLWYAFDHKGCRFIVLYTDEGNPETGERTFSRPECQRMSAEQKAWLADTLAASADRRHIFVFCHHPRWRGDNYGDDWEDVHAMLAEAGNVTAVFGGHVHRLQHDGVHDGIEYLSLATVGGGLPDGSPAAAGHLHHINLVMVRDEGVAMATIPVGGVIDPRAMTVDHHAAIEALMSAAPGGGSEFEVTGDGRVETRGAIQLVNPLPVAVEWTVEVDSTDPRWNLRPGHIHVPLGPGQQEEIPFEFSHEGPLDEAWAPPQWRSSVVFQDEAGSWEIPGLRRQPAMKPTGLRVGGEEGCLRVHGHADAATVDARLIPLADGPLTLEAWFKPDDLSGRRGLLAKTEGSEYGLFGSDGRPSFHVLLGGGYKEVYAEDPLELGDWSHVAGVFDQAAEELRLYVNGVRVGTTPAKGPRKVNEHPLVLGGDVGGGGHPVSSMDGCVDEVRLSSIARYSGDRFQPSTRHERDDNTVLLMHLDGASGPFLTDDSGNAAWGMLRQGASIVSSTPPR